MKRKRIFILEQIITNSINAGFSTRNGNSPVYAANVLPGKRKEIKQVIVNLLLKMYLEVKEMYVIEENFVITYIIELRNELSNQYSEYLYNNEFRIGVSQKIINLFLKYLWCIDIIKEPPFCPIDSQVKVEISKHFHNVQLVDWTEMKYLSEFINYIDCINQINRNCLSVSKWELRVWKSVLTIACT